MASDRNLNHLYPTFRKKVQAIQIGLDVYVIKHMPGVTWKLVEGFRTAEYQNELYQQGRSKPGKKVTPCDGYIKRSAHQSSLAADFLPFKNGQVTQVSMDHWNYYGHLVRLEGLTWGGNWKKRDLPHCEEPFDVALYKSARRWQMKEI